MSLTSLPKIRITLTLFILVIITGIREPKVCAGVGSNVTTAAFEVEFEPNSFGTGTDTSFAPEAAEVTATTPEGPSVHTDLPTDVYFDENFIGTGRTQQTVSNDIRVEVFETTTNAVAEGVEVVTGTSTEPEVGSAQRKEQTRPNVILIIADDLGFNDVSFHGSPQIPTPNIDALALSGVILNSYYVSPICTPSRSALFSGRHPIHTGMQHNVIYGTTPYGFPLKYKLLPEYLKELGYATALVGKWHLGHFSRKYTPTCRGFDSHYGHWTGHKDYYDNMAQESGPQAWGYDMRRNLETTYENFGRYTTDLYTEEANEIIRRHNGSQPLFLTVSHTAVHSANPYQLLQAPKENVDSFAGTISNLQRRTYAAMVQKLDESIGSLVETLFTTGMLSNSLLIFTTDNGGPAAGFNGNAASNWPLRGVKNTLWEGGVRGAGVIWSPSISPLARGVSRNLIHIQDWLPTILRAVGVERPQKLTGRDIDGIDMWESLTQGKPSPRGEVLHNIDELYGNEAVRVGPWKLLRGTTYQGRWDGWYGPSGRRQEKTDVKLTLTPEKVFHWALKSPAGQALNALHMFPDLQKISKTLADSQINCNNTQKKRNKSSCNLLSGEYCLFNIDEDPCEYNNLAKDYPNITDKLKVALKRYKESAVAPRNRPKDPSGLPVNWNYTWTNWVDFLDGETKDNSDCG